MKENVKIHITIKDDVSGEVYAELNPYSIDDAIGLLGAFERRHPDLCVTEQVKDF